ncbi:hypothetical protein TD95_000628 [Thielaviopsis punctulata]|uniref:RING zinc finger-like domain-containing protein n=1 Tax=Thielaviopsis punctulata TaxID=72032 RepID=A0A0F4ZJR0_9PEZI|nr:hypothetical protein TD95_000628 [Thielaviopsis punctulata]
MPPRAPLTSTFPATEPTNEIICPLSNQDGSQCRKRCVGEKRYRSMQEHIRRAHPDHYIPKLPATETSFNMMVNKRPEPPTSAPTSYPAPPSHPTYGNPLDSPIYPHVHAASALAGLHRVDQDWDNESVRSMPTNFGPPITESNNWKDLELPPITSHANKPAELPNPRALLPSSIIDSSPPGRSSTLPPFMTPMSTQKPRNSYARHRHQKSRNGAIDSIKKLQYEDNRVRKAYSAEPSGADASKRWDELITAAGHAADMDSASVSASYISPKSDYSTSSTPAKTKTYLSQAPQSPVSIPRASLPPTSAGPFQRQPQPHPHSHSQAQSQIHHYQASPLQQALTPPATYAQDGADLLQSVESGDSTGSPSYSTQNIQIYCGACHKTSLLRQSYACTECISGFCAPCVQIMVGDQGSKRSCPKCSTVGGRFKPFQLEIR